MDIWAKYDDLKQQARTLLLEKPNLHSNEFRERLEEIVHALAYLPKKETNEQPQLPHFKFPLIEDTDTALLECEVRLQETLEHVSVGVSHIALNGAFINVNSQLCRLTGYSREELLNMTYQQITYFEDIDFSQNLMDKFRKDKLDEINIEKRYIHKNGNLIWVKLHATLIKNKYKKPDYVISVIEDITEKKRAEKTAEKYGNIIKFPDLGFAIVNQNLDNIIFQNQKFKEIQRIAKNQNQSVLCFDTKDKKIKNKLVALIETVNKKGNAAIFENLDTGKAPMQLLTSISLVKNTHDSVANYIIKQLLIKKNNNNKRNEHLIKEEDSELCFELSDEISFNGLLGFSNIVQPENTFKDKVCNFIEMLVCSGHHFLSKVSNILDISLIESQQLKSYISNYNLNQLVVEVYSYFANRAFLKKINFFMSCPLSQTEAEILIDQRSVKIILAKFLEEALQNTKKGHIKLGYRTLLTKGHAQICFYISDTRERSKHHDYLHHTEIQGFDNIYQGKLQENTNLKIAKKYTELINGKLKHEFDAKKENTYSLLIPYKPANDKANQAIEKLKQKFIEHNWTDKTLLIIDEQKGYFDFYKDLLSFTGIKIEHTQNGNDAINVFKSNAFINIVLINVEMDNMKGLIIFSDLKSFNPELNFIAQLFEKNETVEEQCYDFGFKKCINKAMSKNKLIDIFKTHL